MAIQDTIQNRIDQLTKLISQANQFLVYKQNEIDTANASIASYQAELDDLTAQLQAVEDPDIATAITNKLSTIHTTPPVIIKT